MYCITGLTLNLLGCIQRVSFLQAVQSKIEEIHFDLDK